MSGARKISSVTGYTKLFGSIIASTIWRADNETRIVWITMLALANKLGVVEASVPGLADLARLPVDATRVAVANLEAPDLDSRSKEQEGRRILPVDGGWWIVNHAKYRAKMNSEERTEYLRIKKAEGRAKAKQSTNVNRRQQKSTRSTHAEAEAEAEAEAGTEIKGNSVPSGAKRPATRFQKPTLDELKLAMAKAGLPNSEAERFLNHYEANGWRVGKNPMRSWPHAVANWKANYDARNYENRSRTHPAITPKPAPDYSKGF